MNSCEVCKISEGVDHYPSSLAPISVFMCKLCAAHKAEAYWIVNAKREMSAEEGKSTDFLNDIITCLPDRMYIKYGSISK